VVGAERWALDEGPYRWQVSPDNDRQMRERERQKAATAAHRAVGEVADKVGAVLYPPLVVAAWFFRH
jgi:hypothetical protein